MHSCEATDESVNLRDDLVIFIDELLNSDVDPVSRFSRHVEEGTNTVNCECVYVCPCVYINVT